MWCDDDTKGLARIFPGHDRYDGGLASNMPGGGGGGGAIIASHHLIAVLNSSFSK